MPPTLTVTIGARDRALGARVRPSSSAQERGGRFVREQQQGGPGGAEAASSVARSLSVVNRRLLLDEGRERASDGSMAVDVRSPAGLSVALPVDLLLLTMGERVLAVHGAADGTQDAAADAWTACWPRRSRTS